MNTLRSFIATLVYELHPSTDADAIKLLRAHLVGRRWKDRCQGALMPANAVWIQRTATDSETTDDVHDACARDLHDAIAAVVKLGKVLVVTRAWVQVSGAGTYGLVPIVRPATSKQG